MTCELYLIGQPENSGTEIHTIPADSAAKLSFSIMDIEGMQLDGNGGLVISLKDGSQIIIENYEDFASGENQLEMADGTAIPTDSLTTGFQTADALFGTFEVQPPIDNIIDKPSANESQEIALTEGEKYICNFDPDVLNKAMIEVADGKLILNFADGSQLVLANYSDLIEGELPPELTLADGTVIDGSELLTEVLELAESLENIEPAAGEEEELTEEELAALAEDLADLDTAAGGASSSNSGYGFGSAVSSADFDAPDDIGPLDPTRLVYEAPKFTQQQLIDLDSAPVITPGNEFLDETSLLLGPVTREGKINVDFGVDAPGQVLLNGATSTSGSLFNNNLSSNGVPIVITKEGNTYVGKAGTETIFSFELQTNGEYTFTQFKTLDHGDANNDNDTLTINFGVRAVDADGDVTNSSVAVTIADDAPIVLSQITPTLDETDMTGAGLIHVGQFYVDMGQDVNDTGAFSTSGRFAIGGSVNGTDLTSNGVPITITATDTGYVGTAGSVTVFTFNIDPDTGSYGYQQLAGIDHADASDTNDLLTLHFGVEVTDFDGDSADGFITINILDDGPIANDDNARIQTNQSAINGNVLNNDDDGADDFGTVITAGTYQGNFGTLVINSNGTYTYTRTSGGTGTETFNYTLEDADGDTDTAQLTINIVNPPPPPPPPPTGDGDGGDGGDGDGGGGSPIVLDLDGDGIEMTHITDGVQFDMGADGDLDQVAWVQGDDGLLVRDLNNDGTINDHSELYGTLETDGFNVLAREDSNNDGVIDANDENFSLLQIWQDVNQDGISQAGELSTLSDLGITSINLAANMTDYYIEGSWVAYESTFTREDGTTGTVADVWMTYIDQAVLDHITEVMGENAAHEWLSNTYSDITTYIPSDSIDEWTPGNPLVLGTTVKMSEMDLQDTLVSNQGEITVFNDSDTNVSGNGEFHVGGSLQNGMLTSHGQPITITFDSQTGIYTGLAGENLVFNMHVSDDGSYSFNLFDTLDHASEVNLDDNILLQFGVTVTDTDGNSTESAIRIQVRDAGSYLDDDTVGGTDDDNFGSGDILLMDAIGESAETFAAMSQGDGGTDFSLVIDQGDDITETIQEFVHHGGDGAEEVEIGVVNADDAGMFDMVSNDIPINIEDNGGGII